MGKRLVYIDWLKAFGIWLIVFGHVPIQNVWITNWVHSFHVPLFFIISGFLYKNNKKFNSYFITNFERLVLVVFPYYIINTISSYIQIRFLHLRIERDLYDTIANILLLNNKIGPVWFFVSLFWMKIVFYLLKEVCKLQRGSIFLLSVLFSFLFWILPLSIPQYQISSFIMCFPFFIIGTIIKNRNILDKKIIQNTRALLIILIVSLILSIYGFSCTGEINVNGLKFGNSYLLFYSVALCGVATFLCISIMVSTWNYPIKYITEISNGTIVIVGLHMILVQFFKFAYKYIFSITSPPPYVDLFSGVVITFLIIGLLYPLVVRVLHSKYRFIRFFAGKE